MSVETIRNSGATIVPLENGDSGITNVGSILVYSPKTKTVRIYFAARSSSDISGTAILVKVPSGYRPSSRVNIEALIRVDGSAYPASHRCILESDGTITQPYTNSARDVFAFGEYKI